MSPDKKHFTLAAVLLIGSATSSGASAAEIAEEHLQRLDNALRGMLINLAADPLFADFAPEDWELFLTRMPEQVESFGLILNPRFDEAVDENGLAVLAVTPGSPAARMGVRSGDRLVTINGLELRDLGQGENSHAAAYERFQQTVAEMEDGDAIEIDVARGDRSLSLTGDFRRLYLPAASLQLAGQATAETVPVPDPGHVPDPGQGSGCAMVTVREAPPRDFDLYRAEITEINGDRAGATLRSTHYLVPGTYTFTVQEQIPGYELKTELQRFNERRPPLQLELDLKDQQVYHIGAKLLLDRRQQSRDLPYWEPILWKTEPGECTGRPVER